jgi:hypothetical protein
MSQIAIKTRLVNHKIKMLSELVSKEDTEGLFEELYGTGHSLIDLQQMHEDTFGHEFFSEDEETYG